MRPAGAARLRKCGGTRREVDECSRLVALPAARLQLRRAARGRPSLPAAMRRRQPEHSGLVRLRQRPCCGSPRGCRKVGQEPLPTKAANESRPEIALAIGCAAPQRPHLPAKRRHSCAKPRKLALRAPSPPSPRGAREGGAVRKRRATPLTYMPRGNTFASVRLTHSRLAPRLARCAPCASAWPAARHRGSSWAKPWSAARQHRSLRRPAAPWQPCARATVKARRQLALWRTASGLPARSACCTLRAIAPPS